MNFPYVVCEYRASVRSYNAISVRGLRNREFMPSSSKTRGTRLRGPIFCHPQRHRCLVNTHNTSPFAGARANGVPSHHTNLRWYSAVPTVGAPQHFPTPYRAMMSAADMIGEVDLYTEHPGRFGDVSVVSERTSTTIHQAVQRSHPHDP
jgi:hypothetical protein